MTQKQIILRTLDFAALPYYKNPTLAQAARATCIMAWLSDMNKHPESLALLERCRAHPDLADALTKLGDGLTLREEQLGSLMHDLVGPELDYVNWKGIEGDLFVDELWNLIDDPACRKATDRCVIAMDQKTRRSLDEMIDYLFADSAEDWEDHGKPDDHIFKDVERVFDWLATTEAIPAP